MLYTEKCKKKQEVTRQGRYTFFIQSHSGVESVFFMFSVLSHISGFFRFIVRLSQLSQLPITNIFYLLNETKAKCKKKSPRSIVILIFLLGFSAVPRCHRHLTEEMGPERYSGHVCCIIFN